MVERAGVRVVHGSERAILREIPGGTVEDEDAPIARRQALQPADIEGECAAPGAGNPELAPA